MFLALSAKKKKKPLQYLMMLPLLLLGGACGWFAGTLIDTLLPNEGTPVQFVLSIALLFVLLVAAFYLQIILHEGGHLVFGLLTGYRFSSFRIGSVMLVREDGRFRLRRYSLAGTGGQCLMAPPVWQERGVPYALYNLGGVLMNLLVSLLAVLLAYLCRAFPVFSVFCKVTALIGLFIALTNGLPLPLPQVANDGKNLLSIRRDPLALRAFWVQMAVVEQTAKGLRMKDMPADWFVLPEDADLDNPLISSVAVFACSRLMDEAKLPEADAAMASLLENDRLMGIHRSLLQSERLFCELMGENRPEAVAAFRTKEAKQFARAMRTQPSILRTEYAYALLGEHDAEKAEKLLNIFEKNAKTYPYPSEIASERDLIALAQAKR